MANKKNDPNHLGFGRLMAWKSSDIAMAGLNVIVLGYLSIYCSDTLGIAPAVVGTVLMVSKIIDAFTDIFAGWLVDNTHTKLGKGRPYELAIVGVMLCSLGLFSGSPAWSNTLKVVWIFCMYTLVFSIFTTLRGAANTPYTIRHFSNNPILIRKVASYGGVMHSTRTSAKRKKNLERRLDYDEKNQADTRKQKYLTESTGTLLLSRKGTWP